MMIKITRILTVFTLGLTLYSFGASAENDQSSTVLHIQEVTSDKGLKAWLVEDHSIPVIALKFAFRNAGSNTDTPEKQGLARMASNTMDEGAGDIKSQEFQKILSDKSISLTFSATRDDFTGQVKTLTRNKDEAFRLLQLALTKPRFDSEAVDRMRAANQSRIKSSISDPKWIAARLQNDRIFENHPYALNSGGTLSTLAKITPDDLRGFHKTLGKNQLVVSVAGDMTAAELKGILDKIFGTMPDVAKKETQKMPLQNTGKTYLYKQDIPQTIIEISQPGINHGDSDFDTAQVMNFILGESGFGSRLMDVIREKNGLTYGIYSYFREYNEADILHVSTSTVNKSVVTLMTLLRTEWYKMQNNPVSKKELDEAKSYLIGSLPLSFTSTDSIANILTSLQLDHLPIDYLDTRKDRISAITEQDIQKAAKRVLDKNNFTTILVGNPQGIADAEIITTLPNVE